MTTSAPRRTIRHRAWRRMYDAGWARSDMDDTLRSRIAHAVGERGPWWDWGHRVMWLVGRNDGGNAGSPRARDLMYLNPHDLERNQSVPDGMRERCGLMTTTDPRILADNRHLPWKIFDLQDDGHTLIIGQYPRPDDWRGNIIPDRIEGREISLLWRWFLIDHKIKAQWLGLRPWLYWKALHAAAYRRKPFSCQTVPPKGSSGYDHWHCQLRKRHDGPHRYNAYTWTVPGSQAIYDGDLP